MSMPKSPSFKKMSKLSKTTFDYPFSIFSLLSNQSLLKYIFIVCSFYFEVQNNPLFICVVQSSNSVTILFDSRELRSFEALTGFPYLPFRLSLIKKILI